MKLPNLRSRRILSSLIKEYFDGPFKEGKFNNSEYLESCLQKLEASELSNEQMSKDPKVPPRIRARCRDQQFAIKGLINGIKFGISFAYHKDVDLREQDDIMVKADATA